MRSVTKSVANFICSSLMLLILLCYIILHYDELTYFHFFSSKPYVLDHSESIDMHIKKILKKHNFRFSLYGRGRGLVRKLRFFLRLP